MAAAAQQQQAAPPPHAQQRRMVAQGEDDPFVCPSDASRMVLTDTERRHALRIKRTVQESHGLDNLTDFEYAQIALVDQDNLEQALERVHHFQIFREEYELRETCTEGIQLITRLVQLMPEFMLAVTYLEDQQSYALVLDLAKFQESAVLGTIQNTQAFLGAAYTMGHLLSPDFAAIRQGYFCIAECDGYNFTNLSMRTRRRLWVEVLGMYPFKTRKIKNFHTGLFANLAYSLMKRFVPRRIYEKLEMGCSSPHRLDSIYAIPTRQVANQRLLSRITKCLQLRYHNIQTFQLEPEEEDPPPPNIMTNNNNNN